MQISINMIYLKVSKYNFQMLHSPTSNSTVLTMQIKSKTKKQKQKHVIICIHYTINHADNVTECQLKLQKMQ